MLARVPSAELHIDYILTNKNIAQNVDVSQRVNIGSDHRMVRSTIKLNARLERSKMVKSRAKKISIQALMLKESEFQLKLQNWFEALSNGEEVDEIAHNFTETITRCALEVPGKDKKKSDDKLKPETKELLKKVEL